MVKLCPFFLAENIPLCVCVCVCVCTPHPYPFICWVFNLILNLAMRSHDLSHSQLPVLFFLTLYCFSTFGCKEYNQSDFVLTIWWCLWVVFSLMLLEEVVFYDQLFSWQNSVSLCPDSFCTPRPNLTVTLGISWLPTFALESPVMKMTSFGGC